MNDVVGLVPAAGRGKRIAPLPCSKELYPIGFRPDARGDLRPEVASSHLLEKFRRAGITRAVVILRDGKWDIPAYFGDGRAAGLNLAYVVIQGSIRSLPTRSTEPIPSSPARRWLSAFPTFCSAPTMCSSGCSSTCIAPMLISSSGATRRMTSANWICWTSTTTGGFARFHLKPQTSALRFSWICAVWSASFSQFMHDYVGRERASTGREGPAYHGIDPQGDLPVGAVIRAAIEKGLSAHVSR